MSRLQAATVSSHRLQAVVIDFAGVTRKILATLTPRQEKILRMIYGIGEPTKSIEEIAELFNLSRGELEKLHKSALRSFANPTRLKYLLSFAKSEEF